VTCDIYLWIKIVPNINEFYTCKEITDQIKQKNCIDDLFDEKTEQNENFYGKSSSVLLLLIAVILIASNYVLIISISKI
jgi:hypothetical protein